MAPFEAVLSFLSEAAGDTIHCLSGEKRERIATAASR
jgi:hypothetical protein